MAVTWKSIDGLSYDQWMMERTKTLGASEAGIVVFGSSYSSNLELFHNKIGQPKRTVQNLRMFIGTQTEELSSQFWRYYDGKNEQSIVDNREAGRVLRECENRKATAFNSKWPFLSATPDRIILPEYQYKGMGFGSLEIKNTQSYVLNSYESGIPTNNVIQNVVQIKVGDLDFGELFFFIDNARVRGFFIQEKDVRKTWQTILLHTTPFWENVLKARPLYNQMYEAKRHTNMKLAQELAYEIIALEPPPQNTDGYLNFINQRYKDRLAGIGIIKGSEADLVKARKHKELGKKIDKLIMEQRKIEIDLKTTLGNNYKLDFGKEGFVSWYPNKNEKRIFKNNII